MTTTLIATALKGFSSDHRPVVLDGLGSPIITYNAGNASDEKVLADLCELLALDPLAVGLQEVADRRPILAKAAKACGYVLVQPNGPVQGHCALLVRGDANPRNVRLKQISPHTDLSKADANDIPGGRKGSIPTKYVLAVDVFDPFAGQDCTVATMHTTPGASHNATARRLLGVQATNAAAWTAEQPLPTDLMGDCNGQAGRHEFAPLRKVATPYSAPSRKGAAIDIHWVREVAAEPAPEPPKEKPVKFAPPAPPFMAARWHGGKQTPKAIVMHGTVSPDDPGTARAIARFFSNENNKTSAHYIVDPDQVIQCVGDHTVAYHCGWNQDSIGVELCDEQTGPASRWDDADSKAIIARAAELVAQLCLAYDIEPTHVTVPQLKAKGVHGIYSHNQSRLAFGHTTHTDPRQFPWGDFMRQVRAAVAAQRNPEPAAKPVKKQADPKPAPVDRPYHEQAAIDETRTVIRNAAKHGHKGRANRFRTALNWLLGRKNNG